MDATFDEGYISRFEKNFHIMLTANNKNDLPFRGITRNYEKTLNTYIIVQIHLTNSKYWGHFYQPS